MDQYTETRKSYMEPGMIYFWTATIHRWIHLLKHDHFKSIITDSLAYLSGQRKIDVFAFVIMPNHLHMIWRLIAPNGKESPKASFMKYTAHRFQHYLRQHQPHKLELFRVKLPNKNYQFWQRDSLVIRLYDRPIMEQKLTYLHENPLQEHWSLVTDPVNYHYSSAAFYENGCCNFPFLKSVYDEF